MAFYPFIISADQALKDFVDLGLNQKGKKSATIENITAILNKNGVIKCDLYDSSVFLVLID